MGLDRALWRSAAWAASRPERLSYGTVGDEYVEEGRRLCPGVFIEINGRGPESKCGISKPGRRETHHAYRRTVAPCSQSRRTSPRASCIDATVSRLRAGQY